MQSIHAYIARNHHPDLESAYGALVKERLITPDAAQIAVLKVLLQLNQSFKPSAPWFKKWLKKEAAPAKQGIYIYGEVGRGKSMLMDLYFATTHVARKRRVHFHAFMQEVHLKLKAWREYTKDDNTKRDPIPPLARTIAKEARLFCFDEFQVTDIADAMLLGRLFTELFKEGVTIVATSNRHPDDLYKDGLQRENFLPFIDLLKEKVEVVALTSLKDYRLQHLKSLQTTYFTPLGKHADWFMEKTFRELTHGAPSETYRLPVLGREIAIQKTCGDVAALTFKELCEAPLGAADYIEIAKEFGTILLSNIPVMGTEQRNEAKRFITLIDALYEHKVKLLCTASAPPPNLYVGKHWAFEFARTSSRLIEMQSESYLATAHLA